MELSGIAACVSRWASVKGWCRSKAIVRVTMTSASLGTMDEYLELKCPYNTFEVQVSNELAKYLADAIATYDCPCQNCGFTRP